MTLTNPSSPERPVASPLDGLVAHLRSLNITGSATTIGDVYLSAEAINTAFEGTCSLLPLLVHV